jgi:hypothetical protein
MTFGLWLAGNPPSSALFVVGLRQKLWFDHSHQVESDAKGISAAIRLDTYGI